MPSHVHQHAQVQNPVGVEGLLGGSEGGGEGVWALLVVPGTVEPADGVAATEIRSGCCGMAGSFGYEVEHYDISMQIGEMSLFPAIREQVGEFTIVAEGISCRQQIAQGTGRHAKHLVEVLAEGL